MPSYRNEIAVGIPSRPSVDRACVHARAAPYAFESLPVVFVGKPFASAVVYDHYVHV